MRAMVPEGECWRSMGDPGRLYSFCANARTDACNWLVPPGSQDAFCAACRHNGTVPDLSDPARSTLKENGIVPVTSRTIVNFNDPRRGQFGKSSDCARDQ